MDLSALSDSDLEALHKGDYENVSDNGLAYLHAAKQNSGSVFPGAKPPGMIEKALDVLPGMREKREAIANYQSTPEFKKNYPEQVTGMDDPAIQVAGLFSSGGIGVPGLSGLLRKGGDVLMQKSIGATKAIPGFGEQLAAQGLMGTKAGMAGQAARGIESSGQEIGNLAQQIPGQISQDPIANRVANIANQKMTSSGFARPEEAGAVNKVLSRAQDFAKSEPLTGAEMAERRALAGRSAREAGAYKTQPSQQLKAKIASAEQQGYSEALKNAYRGAFPENPEALANADKKYSVLRQAQESLDKPEAISGFRNSLAQYIPTSLLESIGGRTALGTEKVLRTAPLGAPRTLEDLLNPQKPDNTGGMQ